MKSGRLVSVFLASVFAVACLHGQTLPNLVRSLDKEPQRAAQTPKAKPGMEIRRSRIVAINQEALDAPRIGLDVFPDVQFEVDQVRSYWSQDGSTRLWVGKIAGMERGHVVMAVTGEIVSASISTDTEAFYWIRQVDGEAHAIEQVAAMPGKMRNDAIRVPEEEASDSPLMKYTSPERLALTERSAANTQIDVLVCYTQAARAAVGSTAAIQNRIQLAVAESNQGYVNSSIGITLNLVGTQEVNFDESVGIDTTLSRLKGTTDGYMDEIHAARNAAGADLVSLWIQDVGSAGGVVGLAYLMTNVSSSFAGNAFSVVEQYWAPGPGFAFSHEMGHNEGAQHDRANASGSGAYSYSYGYQQPNLPTRFRTIMAYDCSSVYCPTINYFSNPNVSYSGVATGVVSTASNSADNAQTLNNTKATVATFRTASTGCSFSINSPSASYTSTGGSGSVGVTAGSGCGWTAVSQTPSWISVTSGSTGTGNGTVFYSVTANTGSARSGSITIAGQTFTVNQSAPSCSYSLSTPSASFAAAGGPGSVTVTTTSACGWTATPGASWITISSGSSATGSGTVNYSVAANTTTSARGSSISIAGQSFGVSQLAGTAAVTYTVATSPAGLSVSVDGQSVIAPQTFQWTAASSHTVAIVSQGVSPRYVFQSWSDSGAASHTITVPSTSTTYTATLKAQYQVTVSANPVGGGSVTLNPASLDGYYNAGDTVQVTANAATGWQFSGWSGSATGTVNPLALLLDGAKNVTANYQSSSGGVTLLTIPSGLPVRVDGAQYATPVTLTWTSGSTHILEAISPQQATGTRYTFTSWSDGGGMSHAVTASAGSSSSYTANYAVSYQLITTVSPLGSGTVSATPPSADGYYPSGSQVGLQASPASGFQFATWTLNASGSAPTTSVAMNGPRSVGAAFSTGSTCAYLLSQNSVTVPAAGDLRQVKVGTADGCSWNATSTLSWVTISSGASGSGLGTVKLAVSGNPDSNPRTGTVTIAGQSYTIAQAGGGCLSSLTGPGSVLAATSGNYQVTVSTASNCQWTTAATGGWITLLPPQSGTGPGTLNMFVPANTTGLPRTGAISVAGQTLPLVQESAQTTQVFDDVPPAYQFFDYISLLRLNNISAGCGGNNYCPDAPMSRKEMAAFIIRALYGESFAYTQTPYFTDVPSTHTHFAYIQKMKDLGITSGCLVTAYCPEDTVTRGQMAAFLIRARLGISDVQTFPYTTTPYFTDVSPSDMFYPYIQKMKELGITSGCTLTAYCSGDPNTRGQMGPFIVRSFY